MWREEAQGSGCKGQESQLTSKDHRANGLTG
jgi:hypothetical protein